MWVDYRGPLSTVYNDGEISTCGEILDFASTRYNHIQSCTTYHTPDMHDKIIIIIWSDECLVTNYIHNEL